MDARRPGGRASPKAKKETAKPPAEAWMPERTAACGTIGRQVTPMTIGNQRERRVYAFRMFTIF